MSHSGASVSASSAKLFTPFQLGDLTLKNRVVMAPLTRNRASKHDDAPNALNVEYYRQRAGAGLIITEATQISQQGQGYIWTPGIYRDAHIAGWKAVSRYIADQGYVIPLLQYAQPVVYKASLKVVPNKSGALQPTLLSKA